MPHQKRTRRTVAPPRRIVILGFQGAQILDITGPIEVFVHAANWLRQKSLTDEPAYIVELVSLKKGPFITSSGVSMVAGGTYRDVDKADTVLIAGGRGTTTVMMNPEVLDWVRGMACKVNRLGSVCTGALILAKAGLLSGRSATTHWGYIDRLAAIDHSVDVQPNDIYVRDGSIYTSAGVTAGIDMALAMVEADWGQPAALGVAQELVMFLKRPGGQSQFSSHLAAQFSEDDKLRELQLWMLDHLAQDLTVPKLASRAAMSERNFVRHFVASIGTSPAKYVSNIRLEAARRKLEETNMRISEVARRCGFGTQETMRRTFISQLGTSPRDYRARFCSTSNSRPVPA